VVLLDSKNLKQACYHVFVPYARLQENGISSDASIEIYAQPSLFKIHNSIINSLSGGYEAMNWTKSTLSISFTPSTSIANPPSKEESIATNIQAVLRSQDDSFFPTYTSPLLFDYGSFANNRESRNGNCEDNLVQNMPLFNENDFLHISKKSLEINIEKFKGNGGKESFECFGLFVERLVREERIIKVAMGARPEIFNFEARGITQSGTVFEEPFSKVGLNGYGQVVGIADTGLDDLHCFFYDDSGEYPGTAVTTRSLYNVQVIEPLRRKVVSYVYSPTSDTVDEVISPFLPLGIHICST
jgi:hypothetical protein